MGKKLTQEEVIERAQKIHKNKDGVPKYTYSEFIYMGMNIKSIITCPIHGDFSQPPARHILLKCGCPQCSCTKLTREEVIRRAQEIHKDKDGNPLYTYQKLVVDRIDKKSIITCPIHDDFKQTISDHLRGAGCSKCKGGRKLTREEIIERVQKIHVKEDGSPLYTYPRFIVTRVIEKSIITCDFHGDFLQTVADHLRGRGCPTCGIEKRKTPVNELIKKFSAVHKNKYGYTKMIYVNNMTKIIITCPDHEDFLQTPDAHLSGSGCPKCAGRNLEREELITLLNIIHNNSYIYDETDFTQQKIKIFCPSHGYFIQDQTMHRQGQGCPKCKTNKKEEFLIKIFEDYKLNYLYNDRQFIKPLEIDILSHDYKLAIEHNGFIWHSYGKSDWSVIDNYDKLNKRKHLDKTNLIEKEQYQLFHIREDHLRDKIKRDIWKSMILNKCRISHKIHARKLQVINLEQNNEFVKQFLEENHLQGYSTSKIKLGLQDPKTGIVYSIMTFGLSRFDKNIQWELLRFCNLKYHNVRGAASKLLKAFEKWQQPESLISYANRDWSRGNLYWQLGFDFSHVSEPNYIYINGGSFNTISRQQVQKHKLQKFLEDRNKQFDPTLSERDNMINNGYRIFYDTGNLVFHKFYNKG